VTDTSPSERWLELVSTVLLALATVATAWAAYQSREWTGEQAVATSHATAARIAATRSSALADRQLQIDVATFIQWVDAREHDDAKLADFYRARFREEFRPPFSAWLATNPFHNRAAPPTPFAVPEYRLRAAQKADALEVKAAAESGRAKEANRRADNYMLAVVLFASSLFCAGISIKLHSERAKKVLLGLGCVLFLGTLAWMTTFPVQLTI
jgi:hypothetical protein